MLADHETAPSLSTAAGARIVAVLEDLHAYYRERGLEGESLNVAEMAFCTALARYRFGPPLGRMIADRFQVMVFGGAGAGKSTVVNILLGANLADANAQAGYTRRPTAYCDSPPQPGDWPVRLGPLALLDSGAVGEMDSDFYAARSTPPGNGSETFLAKHVVWDCPDLTTKDASYYEFRAIEIAALADVGVYVASDERYNDQLPTDFLQAMLDAGKPVVVALTKVSPLDAAELVRLFEEQVAPKLRHSDRLLGLMAIPTPGRARLDQIWTDAFPYRDELRRRIAAATADAAARRKLAARGVARYLQERTSRLLDPVRKDAGELQAWAEQVRLASNEAVLRYERDHLAHVDFPEFREAADKLAGAFVPDGPLLPVWQGLEALRFPVRWLFRRAADLPLPGRALQSEAALERVRRGLIEQLQVAAAARRTRHRFWNELHRSLDGEALESIDPAFRDIRARQRVDFEERMRRVTGAASALVARRPLLVRALQYGRLILELFLVIGATWWLWSRVNWPVLLVAIPLLLGLIDAAIRFGCKRFIDGYRDDLVRMQRDDVREAVHAGYLEPLLKLPKGAGPRLAEISDAAEKLPLLLAEIAPAEGARP